MVLDSREQPAHLIEVPQWISVVDFAKGGSAAQGQQRIIRDSAKRRAQHGRQRQLVGLVIEKSQQLNQICNLFAFIKAPPKYRLIRNVGAAER